MPEPEAQGGPCEYCGEPVAIRTAGNFIAVRGYEKIRRPGEGGGHGLTRRKTLGKYLHGECMEKLEKGIDPGQGEMF